MDEVDVDPWPAALVGDFAEARQDAMFDSLAQNATAQKKRIDIERMPVELVDHDTDQAIIAEPITDGNGENLKFFLLVKVDDFRFGAPASGEIELIRALSQLGYPGKLIHGGQLN